MEIKYFDINKRYNDKTIVKQIFDLDYALKNAYDDIIPFWKTHKGVIDKGCFCQWHKSDFLDGTDKINGRPIKYCCCEQFMMGQKAQLFSDYESFEKIINSTNPSEIQKLGRQVRNFDSNIWDKFKYTIVFNGNYKKFSQNNELKDFLLSTGDSLIVEASPYDKIWGVGIPEVNNKIYIPDYWQGQNLLGFAIMHVRHILRKSDEETKKFNELINNERLLDL